MTNNTVHYPCKYVPLELLAGFGAACWPCTDEPDSFEVAERLGHPNLCGYGKGLLAQAASGEVHALVLTTCCDVMRRVYDILKAEGNIEFLWLLDLPHQRGAAEVARFTAELRRLAEAYAAYSGESFSLDRALAACVPPTPRNDERVTLMGAHVPLSLAEVCLESVHTHVQNITCTGHERWVASPSPELKRAPKSAAACNACETASTTGDSGVAAGTGAASNPGAPTAHDDLDRFLSWYAGALLNQMPCPRMTDVSERTELVGAPGQRGIIYHTMKFCDYYGLEYADAAQTAAIPVVKVETDGTSQSAGQLKTRLAAFDETLGGAMPSATETSVATAGKNAPVYVLGIDSGSTSTDAVIVNEQGEVIASVIVPTGAKATAGAERALAAVLEQAGLTESQLTYRVATGYGRDAIPNMDTAITEITCHARGAHALAPEARTIIDIGGQDSKVIHLDEVGSVANFIMNDKCAAGTGRFLEVTARALEMSLPEFCQAGLEWKKPVQISSMCTVFAESEVVSLVASDTPVADIVHGLDMSVATKTASLAKRVNASGPYLMTGGVAQNQGVVKALEQTLGEPIATHKDSQLCGAIGAALLGLDALSSAE